MRVLISVCGLVSLFLVFRYNGVTLFDALILLCTVVGIFNYEHWGSINKKNFAIGALVIGYMLVSIVGATLNQKDPTASCLVALRNINAILFSTVCLVGERRTVFLNWMRYSAVIVCCYIFIDTAQYYLIDGISLNERLLSGISDDQAITHRMQIGEALYLRATGLATDPGGIAPGFVMIMASWQIFHFENKYYKNILSAGVLLSLSKTAILGLGLVALKKYRNIVASLVLVTLVALGFILNYGELDSGSERHVKYLPELTNLTSAPVSELLFGYGYRGTGQFYNLYVNEISTTGIFEENGVPESTIVNLFLNAGVFGMVMLITVLSRLEYNREKIFWLVLYSIMGFGYAIENSYLLILLMLVMQSEVDGKSA